MLSAASTFTYDHRGCDITFGSGCVETLESYLAEQGLERAVIVCGSHVGANDAVMQPIQQGLGDRLIGVFDETTHEKRADTAYDAIERIRNLDADVLIGVGGGSSLDIARQASVFEADGRELGDLEREARDGSVDPPRGKPGRTPVLVIPTTLAGADVSGGGAIEIFSADDSPTGQPVNASGAHWPIASFVDPSIIATTPTSVLAGSVMNGFNKGIETPYANDANPMSDAMAVHGIRLFSYGIRRIADLDGHPTEEALESAALGHTLVQLDRKVSIIHAFGQGFARRYPVQQGVIHAIVLPHVLQYLFEQAHASRDLLAQGLGINPNAHTDDALASEIVDETIAIRNAWDLPESLGELSETNQEDIPAIAEFILDMSIMERLPDDVHPSIAEIESVLRKAW